MNELTNELDLAEQRRLLRSWLTDHRSPTARQLAEAGLVASHWPRPWGLDADPHLQLVVAEELAAANVAVPDSTIGLGWAGPTILAGGTEVQHRRWLPGILDGTEMWTQLFSEPDAGSDLASLRTSAERDGDHYVVNGQKIWSTWANRSQWGILLARTDATVAKHQGISYFVVDMATPGVEVRKIIEMTGGNHFNETFLNEVRIPVENRIGADSDGFVTDLLTQKIVDAMVRGEDPSPFASIRKAKADANAQAMLDLICDLAGPAGMLGIQSEESEATDPWHWAYLFSRALTIGGGTSEIQRNIIGERLLGLPREPRPQP